MLTKQERIVFCTTGLPGSGKSDFARSLAENNNFSYFSVSELFKRHAKEIGNTPTELRAHITETIGKRGILRAVMPKIVLSEKKGIVIDGLYRPEDYDEIADTFGKSSVFMLHIRAPKKVRIQRVMKRQSLTATDAKQWIAKADRYRIKQGITDLINLADAQIENKTEKNEIPHNAEILAKTAAISRLQRLLYQLKNKDKMTK